jgi:NDP-sugar pyrophosphorylase family protein
MQAVILAAGRGTRMGALTNELPKPLLRASGKTLLEYKLDALEGLVDEVVIIVGYHETRIREHVGDSHGSLRVTYATQEVLDGTAGALWTAEPYLKDRFVVLMSDDLYARADVEQCIAAPDWAVLVSVRQEEGAGGLMVMEGDRLVAIKEGTYPAGTLANTNAFALDTRLFTHHLVPKSEGSPEYGLPQTVLAASQAGGTALAVVRTTDWFQVTAPEDLPKAEAWLREHPLI